MNLTSGHSDYNILFSALLKFVAGTRISWAELGKFVLFNCNTVRDHSKMCSFKFHYIPDDTALLSVQDACIILGHPLLSCCIHEQRL